MDEIKTRLTAMEELKIHREQTKQTYESMAREIGVSTGTVIRWIKNPGRVGKIHRDSILSFVRRKRAENAR